MKNYGSAAVIVGEIFQFVHVQFIFVTAHLPHVVVQEVKAHLEELKCKFLKLVLCHSKVLVLKLNRH